MRSFSVVVIAAICSTGCSPRESIQDYVARAEVSPRGVLPPVPESHYDAATYQADGLRDPFAAPARREARRDGLLLSYFTFSTTVCILRQHVPPTLLARANRASVA